MRRFICPSGWRQLAIAFSIAVIGVVLPLQHLSPNRHGPTFVESMPVITLSAIRAAAPWVALCAARSVAPSLAAS